jgi:2'-5' RNA ligase
VYSLNAPVPAEISRLARGLASNCFDATPRERHTLVVKRLGDGEPRNLASEVRSRIVGTDPFSARVTGVDTFEDPATGRGPVAYLRIESPGIERLHRRLCERFDPAEGIEADDYVPHITVARGGDAGRLAGTDLDREWTVDALVVWSSEYREPVERIALPVQKA